MSMQNRTATNLSLYVLEFELDMLDSNPAYPSQPKTFGERLRKARMDKGILIKELAKAVGVTENTVINWELKGMKPRKISRNKIKAQLGLEFNDGGDRNAG